MAANTISQDVLYLMLPYIELRDLPHFLCVCKYWKMVLDKYELDLWRQFQAFRCKFQIAQLHQENYMLGKELALVQNAQKKTRIRHNKEKCKVLQASINKAKSMNLHQIKDKILQDVCKTMEHGICGKTMALMTGNVCHAPVAFVKKWNKFLEYFPSEKSTFYAKLIKEVPRACNLSQYLTNDANFTSKSIQCDHVEECAEFVPLVLKLVNLFGISEDFMHTMVKTSYIDIIVALIPCYKAHIQKFKFVTPLSLTAVVAKNLAVLKVLVEQNVDSMSTFMHTPTDYVAILDAKIDCGQVLMRSKTQIEAFQCTAIIIAYATCEHAISTYLQDELNLQLLPDDIPTVMIVSRPLKTFLTVLGHLPTQLVANMEIVTDIFSTHLYYETEYVEALKIFLSRGVNPFLDPNLFVRLVPRCRVSILIHL